MHHSIRRLAGVAIAVLALTGPGGAWAQTPPPETPPQAPPPPPTVAPHRPPPQAVPPAPKPAPEPAPPSDLTDAGINHKAHVYLDSQDGGTLVPAPPTLPDCVTKASRDKVMAAYFHWQDDYGEALDDVRTYIERQLRLQGYQADVDAAHAAEVNALAEIGVADARAESAARDRWEKAKAAKQKADEALSQAEYDAADWARVVQSRIRTLRKSRDAFRQALAAAIAACPPPASRPVSQAAVLEELNFARTRPADYAASRLTGADAEAARSVVAAQAALPALTINPLLTGAADGHAAEQAASGGHAHTGADGSTPMQRMQRAGVWATIYAEEITTSAATAEAVVRSLIIDAGAAGAPHRGDVFSPNLKFAGIGCATGRDGKPVCVIDLTSKPPE